MPNQCLKVCRYYKVLPLCIILIWHELQLALHRNGHSKCPAEGNVLLWYFEYISQPVLYYFDLSEEVESVGGPIACTYFCMSEVKSLGFGSVCVGCSWFRLVWRRFLMVENEWVQLRESASHGVWTPFCCEGWGEVGMDLLAILPFCHFVCNCDTLQTWSSAHTLSAGTSLCSDPFRALGPVSESRLNKLWSPSWLRLSWETHSFRFQNSWSEWTQSTLNRLYNYCQWKNANNVVSNKEKIYILICKQC